MVSGGSGTWHDALFDESAKLPTGYDGIDGTCDGFGGAPYTFGTYLKQYFGGEGTGWWPTLKAYVDDYDSGSIHEKRAAIQWAYHDVLGDPVSPAQSSVNNHIQNVTNWNAEAVTYNMDYMEYEGATGIGHPLASQLEALGESTATSATYETRTKTFFLAFKQSHQMKMCQYRYYEAALALSNVKYLSAFTIRGDTVNFDNNQWGSFGPNLIVNSSNGFFNDGRATCMANNRGRADRVAFG